jgi:hypothetical protein
LNSTQVVRAAILDLLTGQCDRSPSVRLSHHCQCLASACKICMLWEINVAGLCDVILLRNGISTALDAPANHAHLQTSLILAECLHW